MKGRVVHQSLQKHRPGRRDKYGVYDTWDAQAERRMYRGGAPKARRDAREEEGREARGKQQHPRAE